MDLFFYLLSLSISVVASIHVILRKKDPRSALGWLAACLFVPFLGAAFYALFGTSRVRRRARRKVQKGNWRRRPLSGEGRRHTAELAEPELSGNIESLLKATRKITGQPLLAGNAVTPLHNGEGAYPRMLERIRQARTCIYLSTFIFESNRTGREFKEALAAAAERGVEVCVLIDSIGELYSFPLASSLFKGTRVKFSPFRPQSPFGRLIYINFRIHRKIMVVDGEVGFTGGMNIGDRHLIEDVPNSRASADIHFEFTGPIVQQMAELFTEDWLFATGEQLTIEPQVRSVQTSESFCRGITSGPNEENETMLFVFLSAIWKARRSIKIMTPYFVPERQLIFALKIAAIRGIQIDVLLPEKNNLWYVERASRSNFEELLECGVRLYKVPPPFFHTKFFLIDDEYLNVGSSNIDSRSFRINFEYNVEIIDTNLSSYFSRYFATQKEAAVPVTRDQIKDLPLVTKIVDSTFRLFTPYL